MLCDVAARNNGASEGGNAMLLYDDPMAPRVDLPDEAPDLTATIPHNVLLHRLFAVLGILFDETTLVMPDCFVRVNDRRQVAPDLTIVHGTTSPGWSAYRIPPKPVPHVTLEVLSAINDTAFGRGKLQEKRELLGAIGVPVHIELDEDRGIVTVWRNVGGTLQPDPPTTRYDGDDLGGLHIELSPGEVTLRLPDGSTFTDTAGEFRRAQREAERADSEAERAEREAERADSEAERAEREGERADRLSEALRNAGIDPESL
jgi:hypothetical protein